MKSFRTLPTQARLREILDYDQRTGTFRWKNREDCSHLWKARCAGKVAGTRLRKAIVIFVDGKPYYAHRLIWVYVHGFVPSEMLVDHKNCDPFDNRLSNLRLATHGQNAANSRLRKNRKQKFPKGVYKQMWRKGSFVARIGVDGEIFHLGTFKTVAAAHAAYLEAAKKAKGEFARGA